MAAEHFDVIIVGAGLSGIGAAYHLQTECPRKSFVILEGRGATGGTWDLFRYPGIRSDSDMYTLGYIFKPWREAKAIADAHSILRYVRETAAENDIEKHIRFHHQVKRADWSSADARWTVEGDLGAQKQMVRFTCNFLFMCSGYYAYAGGHDPEFAGRENFQGRIVRPQFWPQDLDYKNKQIVVIGSGATAVTLVPELAKDAAHVTMLQRSPSYVVSRPSEDAFANWLRGKLPSRLAYGIARWRNVLMGMLFFSLARKKPDKVKKQLIDMAAKELGPDYDVGKHFTPHYNPWTQRLCLVPGGDLFRAIREGRASVVTDRIATFTPDGIRLASGRELAADIIVTATGLKLEVLGGVQVSIDGVAKNFSRSLSYKGMMSSDVPNLASVFGYINASWTLRCDLICAYLCRLLNYMDRHGYASCMPALKDTDVKELPFFDFSSGYLQRARDILPKQGSKKPWRLYQNYARDLLEMRYGRIDDGTMEFAKRPVPAVKQSLTAPIAAE